MFIIKGIIQEIKEIKEFKDGAVKTQELLIESYDKYPQTLSFSLVNKAIELLEGKKTGDHVYVDFGIRGREWQGRHYVSLNAFKIRHVAGDYSGDPPKLKMEPDESQEDPPF